jgi:hypothetical protein
MRAYLVSVLIVDVHNVSIIAFLLKHLSTDGMPCTGLMALVATSMYYDTMEIGTRILPSVVVLTVDVDRYCIAVDLLLNTESFLASII